jgi:hypothetical protein
LHPNAWKEEHHRQGTVPALNREEADLEALDLYIRTQLAKAAESYTSRVDIEAKLQAILAPRTEDE